MTSKKSNAGGRESAARSAPARRRTTGRTGPARPRRAGASRSGSVIMQARVPEDFARVLLEQDAAVLGLDGPSALVREGLRLVHDRAREAAVAASYDEFYGGELAPLPPGVAPATGG